jgi:hypothetical protein
MDTLLDHPRPYSGFEGIVDGHHIYNKGADDEGSGGGLSAERAQY